MPVVRVLVVDDHPVVRRMVCALLSKDPTLEIVCETATAEEAITKVEELQPDVVVLDITLPGLSGIGAAPEIMRVSPTSKIIFLSQHTSLHVVREALKAGGLGFVSKSDAGQQLLEAVRAVSGGERFISHGIRKEGWTSDETDLVS